MNTKKLYLLVAMICVLVLLSPGVDSSKRTGLSIGDIAYIPEIQGPTLLVFLDLEHKNDFIPFLNDVANRYLEQLSVLIVAAGNEKQAKEQLLGLPVIMDSTGQITRSFQQGLVPCFYLVNSERKILYKHTLFALSEWVAIEGVLQDYLDDGIVQEESLEYSLEEQFAFPFQIHLNESGDTMTPGKVSLILLMEPYPQAKEIRKKGYVSFLKKVTAEHKIQPILMVKDEYAIETSNYNSYLEKYELSYPPLPNRDSWWKKFTRWVYFKLLRVKTYQVTNDAWRKLGFPSTPTFILVDQRGVIRDTSCARCVHLSELEEYYRELIPKLH